MSSYYYARKRESEPAAREIRDAVLKEKIMEVWAGEEGRKVYGARKIWLELNSQGVAVARCTVERLMRELGICGASPGRKRPPPTLPGDPRTGRVTCWSGVLTRRRRTAAPREALRRRARARADRAAVTFCSWHPVIAVVGRGPVRGPGRPCKRCNQGHQRRGSMVSVQVAHSERRAVLLIIRRSWVRAPPAPLSLHPP